MMVEKYYQTVEAMFLQEAGSVEWEAAEGYSAVKNSDSVIFYRTEVFGRVVENETKKWERLLNMNEDTVMVITEKKYLLVSSHFTSSKEGYLRQEEYLFKVINYMLDYYEKEDFKVVVGMDANHFIASPKLNCKNYIVPRDPSESTTIKKRSYIQAQLHKADQCVNEVKDHIVSNL